MDIRESEIIFRANEANLDDCLKSSISHISSLGIALRDAGNRNRLDLGHGLDRLWWGYFFEKQWKSERTEAFVSLRVSYSEPYFSQPPVIYGSLYSGEGGVHDLSARVASGKINRPKSIRIGMDELLAVGFASFVTDHLAGAGREIGQLL